MNKLIKFSIFILLFSSCRSSYTGFNAFRPNPNAIKPKTEQPTITQISKVENISDEVLIASVNPIKTSNSILEKLKNIEKSKTVNESVKPSTVVSKSEKLTFKEKLINKMVQKQIKKANMNPAQPDGFSNLDGKLKIGLILLAVAIGLSIIGLGGLGGLAGLIGLIFVVIGLLNMYN